MHKITFSSPDDFVQGGLVADIDVEFRNVRYAETDYNGAVAEMNLCLMADLHEIFPDGEVSEAPVTEQIWGIGKMNGLEIVDDGKFVHATAEGAKFRKGSNFYLLVESLTKAGFAFSSDGSATQFNGLKAHVIRIPQPERSGIAKNNDKGLEKTVLVVDRILSQSGGKKTGTAAKAGANAAKAGAGTAAKANSAAASAVSEEEVKETLSSIVAKLVEDDKLTEPVPYGKFRLLVVTSMTQAKVAADTKNAVTGFMKSNEALAEFLAEQGLSTDGESVSVG